MARIATFFVALLVGLVLPLADAAAGPAIAAGGAHSCAVTRAGAALCWGDNSVGTLGDGIALQNPSPAPVSGLSSGVAAIATGAYHSCALTSAGAVLCWGHNGQGMLGNGTTTESSVPIPVSGLSSGVTAIAAGGGHTCALTSAGAVLCWGEGYSGQLGNGARDQRFVPTAVTGLSSGVTAITAGGSHTCALTSAGAVQCWGYNDHGQLGNGAIGESLTPVSVGGLPSPVASLAAGYSHTCARTNAGAAFCWGNNGSGQLGTGTANDSAVPVPVTGLSSGVASVTTGSYHSCALNTSGGMACWGDNFYGTLGNGTTTNSRVPIAVSGLSSGVASLARGEGYAISCAITTAGAARCWGYNAYSQLGNGTTANSSVPQSVIGLSSGVAALATGALHACALTTGGGVLCWGDDSALQLGNGRTIGISTPGPVSGLSSGVAQIATSIYHACALTTAGGVMCWGRNARGELGTQAPNSSVPVAVTGLSSGATAVATGFVHSCALMASREVRCWGENLDGQLGDGTTTNSVAPVQVTALPGEVVAIATGQYQSCALDSSGAVSCWGYNADGEVGDGTRTNRSAPVAVSGLSSGVAAIAAGSFHTCASTTAGNVLCWGFNGYGQLGNGTTTDSPVPVPVTGLTSPVTAISAGQYHTCALTTSGGVMCWGDNRNGGLGNATTTDSASPVPVAGLSSGVAAIAAGAFHTCARTTSGTALCWGYNSSGGLGDATFANRTTPVVAVRALGAGSLAANDWFLDLDPGVPKTIPADRIPSYLLVTSGNATTAVVNIKADVRFRPADVGNAIHVFAYAPASLVKSLTAAKDGPTCVLAQLSSSGQLQQATASGLQGYVSNVTSSQQQAVTILNNVSSAQVAGATFCVGTGATGAQSVDPSNSVCVATVPGASDCLPLQGGTNVAANVPGALSGLWWNAAESGWGIHFTQRASNVFAAWYTYDGSGNPRWYVASNCTGATGTSGTCSGTLYEVNGPTFFGTTFNPGAVNVVTAGSLQVAFQNANAASMSYTVAGQSRTVAIVRQPLGSGAIPGVDYTDLWWNPSESGWGMAIAQQAANMFLAWYVYDGSGKPVWYVASNCTASGTGCTGTLYRTTGPPFGPTFNPSMVQVFTVGTATLAFTDPNNGMLSYTVNGVSGSKAITRQLF